MNEAATAIVVAVVDCPGPSTPAATTTGVLDAPNDGTAAATAVGNCCDGVDGNPYLVMRAAKIVRNK